MSAVAFFRAEIASPQASDLGDSSTFFDYHEDVDGKADWKVSDLNAADELLKHTVLKTKLKKTKRPIVVPKLLFPRLSSTRQSSLRLRSSFGFS